MSKSPFKEGKCYWPGCKRPIMIIRPDGLPFCSEHEKYVTERAQQLVPKLKKMDKLKLHTRAPK